MRKRKRGGKRKKLARGVANLWTQTGEMNLADDSGEEKKEGKRGEALDKEAEGHESLPPTEGKELQKKKARKQ